MGKEILANVWPQVADWLRKPIAVENDALPMTH